MRRVIFTGAMCLAATMLSNMNASAGIILTNTSNISLTASQVQSSNTAAANPDVTGGLAGPLVAYTETGNFSLNQHLYGGFNLDDNDVGDGTTSDGLYAILRGSTLQLDFDSSTSIGSIAIYNGYANRDNGTYTLSDGTSTLGQWTVSTSSNVDAFWLTFDTPITTGNLDFVFTNTEAGNSFASFREIQLFEAVTAVPEPSSIAVIGLLGLIGFGKRRKRHLKD